MAERMLTPARDVLCFMFSDFDYLVWPDLFFFLCRCHLYMCLVMKTRSTLSSLFGCTVGHVHINLVLRYLSYLLKLE